MMQGAMNVAGLMAIQASHRSCCYCDQGASSQANFLHLSGQQHENLPIQYLLLWASLLIVMTLTRLVALVAEMLFLMLFQYQPCRVMPFDTSDTQRHSQDLNTHSGYT